MTISAAPPAADSRALAAERLWRAAALVLAIMPVAMAIANRSAPLVLGIGTALAVAAAVLDGQVPTLLRTLRARLATPLGAAILALLAWATLSIAWSEFRLTSWRAFAEFWSTIAAVFVLASLLPGRVPRRILWVLCGSIALACISMSVELSTGMVLRQGLGIEAWTFIFNRPILTVTVLVVPALAWLAGREGKGPLLGLALAALVFILNVVSDSGAASLGLIAMIPTAAVAWFRPRLALGLAGIAIVAAFLIAPFQGRIAERLLPQEAYTELAGGHSRERVALWQSFGAVIERQPGLGGGFGISPQMPRTQVARTVPRELRRMLTIGHPHNAAMQIWVELGAVGAGLSVAILLMTLWRLRNLPARHVAPALALMAGAGAASLVGHGAWQGWWAAAIGAAIIWLLTLNHDGSEAS